MWASRRVERLLGEERRGGSQQHQSEIVRLSEGYSIVSPYASFIVLENDAEYRRWQIERRNATRVARDRAAQESIRARLREATASRIGPNGDQTAANSNDAESSRDIASTPSAPVDIRFDVPRGVEKDSGGNGGSGGGAIDPLTAVVAAGLAGLGLASRRRDRRLEVGG
jgi:hypothetical protein